MQTKSLEGCNGLAGCWRLVVAGFGSFASCCSFSVVQGFASEARHLVSSAGWLVSLLAGWLAGTRSACRQARKRALKQAARQAYGQARFQAGALPFLAAAVSS